MNSTQTTSRQLKVMASPDDIYSLRTQLSCSRPAKIQINDMSHSHVIKQFQAGFTLLEMLITLTIVAVLAALAVPGLADFGVKQRLIGAAEQVYGHIQQARSDAIASSRNTFVKFATASPATTTWQYGVSDSATNDCDLTVTAGTTANACIVVVNDGDGTIDGVGGGVDADDRILMRFTNADYAGNDAIKMGASTPMFTFDSVRGTLNPATAGQINLESTTGLQLRVVVSLLGRVSICSPGGSVANYEVC
jgi:type IV fimbrial biogenesis protein FimT